ncbi:uroplakin-3b-like [Leptodactylus fuscus]|uniref:uroplakin-3b-like n=1 Tax=Leptodactylus fuscus TaxID=238119 RepID=UPI003F4EFA05
MDPLIKLGLLLMGATVTFAEVRYYVPQITVKKILGKLTNNSFALDQPQCIFQQFTPSEVWLVVALDTVVPNLSVTNLSNPSDFKLFQSKKYYHIYQMPAATSPCSDTAPSPKALVPVGTQLNCTNVSFCNGILTNNGPYRVKFVLLNNNTVIQETRWSEKFNLITGNSRDLIDIWPKGRSAGMIVLVVILSVLLALLLALLIAAIATGSKNICWQHILKVYHLNFTSYRTHHIYMTHSSCYLTPQSNKNSVYTVFT